MNFTGCRSGNASSSKSLSSCDIVSSVRRLSIWLNSVVQWVHPLVGRVYALPRVVISLFRDSDFEDLATGLLLSLGPMCGTLFRPKLDRVTIYYSSRVNWKPFCSSSFEPFCGSISNEGPYKYSIYYYYYNYISGDNNNEFNDYLVYWGIGRSFHAIQIICKNEAICIGYVRYAWKRAESIVLKCWNFKTLKESVKILNSIREETGSQSIDT